MTGMWRGGMLGMREGMWRYVGHDGRYVGYEGRYVGYEGRYVRV